METVRKWEIRHVHVHNPQGLLSTMPEIFKDKARTWYRHNRKQCTPWNSFKAGLLKFFYPPRYLIRLEDEICSRTQRTNETFEDFEDYALAWQHLMRDSKTDEKGKLEWIFRDALLDYMWYIRRRDCNLLGELVELVEDLESIPTANSCTSHREQH